MVFVLSYMFELKFFFFKGLCLNELLNRGKRKETDTTKGIWEDGGGISPLGVLGQKKGEGWALCSAPLCCLTASYEPGVRGDASTYGRTHTHTHTRRVVRARLRK